MYSYADEYILYVCVHILYNNIHTQTYNHKVKLYINECQCQCLVFAISFSCHNILQ